MAHLLNEPNQCAHVFLYLHIAQLVSHALIPSSDHIIVTQGSDTGEAVSS